MSAILHKRVVGGAARSTAEEKVNGRSPWIAKT